jgi:hypothetical protein
MHHVQCIRQRKCVAFAHKQRGKQSTVASPVKNSQSDGVPRSLLNNAGKQLFHTQAQWRGTPLQKGTTLRNNRHNNSSFAMPCKVLAYPIRTVTHTFPPTDTPANRGKSNNSHKMESNNSEREGRPSSSNIPQRMERSQGPAEDVKATSKQAFPTHDTQVQWGVDKEDLPRRQAYKDAGPPHTEEDLGPLDVKSNNHPPLAGPHAQGSNTENEQHSSQRIYAGAKTKTVVLDMVLDVSNLEDGMKVLVIEQPAWVIYNLGDLGTDACQSPI